MILNTGGRTDTVQYYTDWLLRRFQEGYVLSRNPLFPHKVTRYELTPEQVDCVVFCSKNYAPILPRLHEITDRFPTYFYYTITAYGRDIEPGVPSLEASMETLLQLSRQVGRQRLAWRYDPVLLTETYTIQRHLDAFAHMAETLTPYVDRCIFSFVERYKKLETNMPELLPLTPEDREALAQGLGAIAQEHAGTGELIGHRSHLVFPKGCPARRAERSFLARAVTAEGISRGSAEKMQIRPLFLSPHGPSYHKIWVSSTARRAGQSAKAGEKG